MGTIEHSRNVLVAGCAAAFLLVLTACGTAPSTSPASPIVIAEPLADLQCVDDFAPNGSVQPPPIGDVPEGFDAVAVYRCGTGVTETDEAGIWSGTRITKLEGDLSALMTALAEPDDPPGWVCPAMGYLLPDLWLADGDNRFVHVGYPAAPCGPKTDGVDAALAELSEVESRFQRSVLVESTAAAAAGCASEAGVIVLVSAGDLPAEPDEAVPVEPEDTNLIAEELPSLPQPGDVVEARVCAYAVQPTDPTASAAYSEAWSLDLKTARAVLDEIGSAGQSSATCTAVASQLVVVQFVGKNAEVTAATVELDGCRRVVDAGFRAATASDTLVTLLAQR